VCSTTSRKPSSSQRAACDHARRTVVTPQGSGVATYSIGRRPPSVRQINLLPWLRKKHSVSGKSSSSQVAAPPPASAITMRIVMGRVGSEVEILAEEGDPGLASVPLEHEALETRHPPVPISPGPDRPARVGAPPVPADVEANTRKRDVDQRACGGIEHLELQAGGDGVEHGCVIDVEDPAEEDALIGRTKGVFALRASSPPLFRNQFLRARGRWAGTARSTGRSAATRWPDRAARRAAARAAG
jgi:hypothetical protein